ncbi:hypothetical protein [Paraburkholderia sp. SIMBA_054]|uniref:hypothetical protein n=1 Tax=Paraburkholderia sp. SIMBA_054 TaxID=3085795 RepID=UPI00397CD22F
MLVGDVSQELIGAEEHDDAFQLIERDLRPGAVAFGIGAKDKTFTRPGRFLARL